MKRIYKVTVLMFSLIPMTLLASEIVATVNGAEITQEDVNEFVVASIPGANFEVLNETQKKSVVNQMIERKLFLEDAKKIKIDNNPEFVIALQKLKENLMLDYWMKEKVEEIFISDEEAKAYYQENKKKFNNPASVKVRHILLATEAEAVAIINELENHKGLLKEKFIELARTKSTGPSAVNGGELDWFIHEQMVPEFSTVAFLLKKGSITKQPVQTQFGYHVIYLEDKKEQGFIPFENVKAEIVKSLRLVQFKTKLDKLSEKLKKTAKITVK
ncbi:peptidylprolyl isomerase [bacterium]|nr:peptidylprolyl isomerase [bacterium]MBU1956962.1 peptidylprolyl isomerase [bacterium]